MKYIVKIAADADLDAIHAYLNFLFGLRLEGISLREHGISKEEVKDFLPDDKAINDQLCLIALNGDDVIGCLTFSRYSKPEYRHAGKFGMSVHPDYWKNGIGGLFLAEMEKWSRNHDFLKIQLEVWSNNIDAIRLYEKNGYSNEGCRKGSIIRDSNIHDLLLMGKWIG
jgi:hypothetical protein